MREQESSIIDIIHLEMLNQKIFVQFREIIRRNAPDFLGRVKIFDKNSPCSYLMQGSITFLLGNFMISELMLSSYELFPKGKDGLVRIGGLSAWSNFIL